MSDIGFLWTGLGLSWCIILYLDRKYWQVRRELEKKERESLDFELWKTKIKGRL